MSLVDNYILLISDEDYYAYDEDSIESKLEELNMLLLNECERPQIFKRFDKEVGGYKGLEGGVYGLAGNYLCLDDIMPIIKKVKWSNPKEVILLHKGQEENTWKIYKGV